MTFTPTRRYSAVAVFSEDLEWVVLVHKLRPAWQAGKANFPGGKVEDKDMPGAWYSLNGENHGRDSRPGDKWFTRRDKTAFDEGYRRCAVRELAEETGLVVATTSLKLFCTLRFRNPDDERAECQFFCCRGDVEAARTMEEERAFAGDVGGITCRHRAQSYARDPRDGFWRLTAVPTMSNLPWLVAMARQTLRGDGSGWPYVVYEAGCHV